MLAGGSVWLEGLVGGTSAEAEMGACVSVAVPDMLLPPEAVTLSEEVLSEGVLCPVSEPVEVDVVDAGPEEVDPDSPGVTVPGGGYTGDFSEETEAVEPSVAWRTLLGRKFHLHDSVLDAEVSGSGGSYGGGP